MEKIKNVLMVMAHPDDELIFGWPVLQNPELKKEIVICVSDEHHPKRKWCAHRKYALFALCEELNIPCKCLNLDSGFFRGPGGKPKKRKKKFFSSLFRKQLLPTLTLGEVASMVLNEVKEARFDAVFTHNFWGEYGHMDHILLNNILFGNLSCPILTTNAYINGNWLPHQDVNCFAPLLKNSYVSSHTLDLAFYERCSSFYTTTKTWTWSSDPIEKLDLHLFNAC